MASAAKTIYAHVTKDPAVAGGSACIDATRIRVIDVVQAHSEGYAPTQIQTLFAVQLTLAQVYSALAYADENRQEMQSEYAEQVRAFDGGVNERPKSPDDEPRR
jgi:uncharacterized protein (DUF433 family)